MVTPGEMDEQPAALHPLSAEHALRAGMVWGIGITHGLDLRPMLDAEGNYTAALELRSDRLPPGVTITLIVAPPEDERP
jgi:hypothetical protein